METVYLCSVNELDINYENVFDFGSRAGQQSFFTSKAVLTVDNINMQDDGERQSVVIGKTLRELEAVDYLFFVDDSGKARYYFVKNKEFKTKGATRLILQLDQWSTYLFDFTLMESYIERCHVNRWGSDNYPTREIEDEGLEFGENVASTNHNLFENKTPGMIIVTNIPIGKVPDRKQATGGGGGGGADCGGSPMDGIISAKGYRFIKGYEGFGKNPYIVTGESWHTAGYGITDKFKPKYYEQLKPFPVTEQKASEVYGDMVINDFGLLVRDALKGKGVNVDIMPVNEFDAFVSLSMNMGYYGMVGTDVFKWYCEKRPTAEIAERWLTTAINPGTAVEPGLRARRKAESTFFAGGGYEFRSIVTINANGSYGPPVTENGGHGFIPPIFGNLDGSCGGGDLQSNIVLSARKLIGKPYVFGGNYPPLGNDKGTDCSGLIQWAYNDNGKKITRTTYTQINEGSEIYKVAAREADLIFTRFSGSGPEHVVLFDKWIDKDKGLFNCIEAPRTGLDIRERQMTWEDGVFRGRRLV